MLGAWAAQIVERVEAGGTVRLVFEAPAPTRVAGIDVEPARAFVVSRVVVGDVLQNVGGEMPAACLAPDAGPFPRLSLPVLRGRIRFEVELRNASESPSSLGVRLLDWDEVHAREVESMRRAIARGELFTSDED